MFSEAETDPALSADEYKPRALRLRTALLKAQYARLERADRSLLIVVAGIDGAGKGQTINLLNNWMDPRHIHTLAFGEPDARESQFPPLWRYWNAMPAKGETGVVFGSWYSRLLRECYRKKFNPERAEALAAQIRRFETMLTAEGVQIVKLWFHLSPQAQAARIERLNASPETSWQVSPDDYKVQKKFDRIRDAAQLALAQTDIDHAPWVVIPSADDHLRTIRCAETILATMKRRAIPVVARVSQQLPRLGPIPDRLGELDYEAHEDKHDYDSELGLLQGRLARAVRSPAFAQRSLVLAFEGQDAAGKGGAIQRVVESLDARQYDITPIAAPAAYEQARPYLWRFWRHVPAHNRVALFDRTWYGRVLVERVEGLTPPGLWRRAYAEINDFEHQLTESGAIVLKFWLAITQDVQLERFKEREATPFKRYKITAEDWRNRDKWDEYALAANEMMARTDLPHAPWHLVPANDKRHARLQVLRAIVSALESRL